MMWFISGNCSAANLSIQASILCRAVAVVPGGSVVGRFKDAVRFLVQDHPAVGEGVTRRFEYGGVLPDGIEESGPYRGVSGAGG